MLNTINTAKTIRLRLLHWGYKQLTPLRNNKLPFPAREDEV